MQLKELRNLILFITKAKLEDFPTIYVFQDQVFFVVSSEFLLLIFDMKECFCKRFKFSRTSRNDDRPVRFYSYNIVLIYY